MGYATVCGWGNICEESSDVNVLRYAIQKIYPQNECEKTYSGIHSIGEGMICAFPSNDTSCVDDGGPLMYYRDGKYFEQIGIASFGLGCGKKPSVFTRVDKYLDWIKRNSNI